MELPAPGLQIRKGSIAAADNDDNRVLRFDWIAPCFEGGKDAGHRRLDQQFLLLQAFEHGGNRVSVADSCHIRDMLARDGELALARAGARRACWRLT